MTNQPGDMLSGLTEYLDGYSTFPRKPAAHRRHGVDVETFESRTGSHHPRLLEIAFTVGLAGVLFAVMAVAFGLGRSQHATGAAHHNVSSAPAALASATPGTQANTAGATSCSQLSVPLAFIDYKLDPPGAGSPKVTCLEAVSVAVAACPLEEATCPGASPPQVAELSLIADFPGSRTNDPPRLVWAVTWTPSTCRLPSTLGDLQFISAPALNGNLKGCHWVSFVDAATGKLLLASFETPNSDGEK